MFILCTCIKDVRSNIVVSVSEMPLAYLGQSVFPPSDTSGKLVPLTPISMSRPKKVPCGEASAPDVLP
jgi:hypothetical protein